MALDWFLRLTTPLVVRWDLPPVLTVKAPAIFVGNHRSIFDIVVGVRYFGHFGASPRILVAGRYFSHPLYGRLLRLMGAIPVNGSGLAALKEALASLEAGESVVIMPEGRVISLPERDGGVGIPASGVGLLAVRSGVPMGLCGITGSEFVWPPGERRIRLSRPSERPVLRVQAGSFRPLPARFDRESIAEDVMAALAALVGPS